MNSELIDLNEVLAGQVDSIRQKLGNGIVLEVVPAVVPAKTRGDEAFVGQILGSLAAYAQKSLAGAGKVQLVVECVEVDEIHARIQPRARRGRFVRLTMADNGRGLRHDELQRRFNELPAKASAVPDPTLPLPLIAGIIRRRAGWIEAHTHTGGGTTIYVYLPEWGDRSARSLAAARLAETVLLVDDEAHVRRMVREVLERASYQVVEAESGGQALEVWEQHAGQFQLLLTDMVMPNGLNGRQLAHKLKTYRPGLKVIYTSGYDLDGAARQDTEYGGIPFLHKPYDSRRLLETVHLTMLPKRKFDRPLASSASL